MGKKKGRNGGNNGGGKGGNKAGGAGSGKAWGPGVALGSGEPPGLERVVEGGDGNCLFRAIARQALSDPGLHGRTRSEICDWMTVHLPPSAMNSGRSALSEAHRRMICEQRAELLAADDEPVLEYIRKMRVPGEWGTGLEALCAAYHYGRRVHVWDPVGSSELTPPALFQEQGRGSSEPIRLLHNGKNHWDSASLRPNASGISQSAGTNVQRATLRDGVLFRASALLPSSKTKEIQQENASARDEEDDVAMALVLSIGFQRQPPGGTAESGGAALQNQEGRVPGLGASSSAEDDRATRRALAAAAAQERARLSELRGLGSTKPSGQSPCAATEGRTGGNPAAKPAIGGDINMCTTQGNSGNSCEGGPEEVVPSSAQCSTGRWHRRTSLGTSVPTAAPAMRAIDQPCPPVLVLHPVEDCEPAHCDVDEDHHPAATDINQCIAALGRVGLTLEEATEAIWKNCGDVEQVKALYGIDWDAQGRTIQLPFQM